MLCRKERSPPEDGTPLFRSEQNTKKGVRRQGGGIEGLDVYTVAGSPEEGEGLDFRNRDGTTSPSKSMTGQALRDDSSMAILPQGARRGGRGSHRTLMPVTFDLETPGGHPEWIQMPADNEWPGHLVTSKQPFSGSGQMDPR